MQQIHFSQTHKDIDPFQTKFVTENSFAVVDNNSSISKLFALTSVTRIVAIVFDEKEKKAMMAHIDQEKALPELRALINTQFVATDCIKIILCATSMIP